MEIKIKWVNTGAKAWPAWLWVPPASLSIDLVEKRPLKMGRYYAIGSQRGSGYVPLGLVLTHEKKKVKWVDTKR